MDKQDSLKTKVFKALSAQVAEFVYHEDNDEPADYSNVFMLVRYGSIYLDLMEGEDRKDD